MVRTFLYMVVCVPGLALSQTDSMQTFPEDSRVAVGNDAVVGVDSTSRVTPREHVMEGREVVASGSADPTRSTRLTRDDLSQSASLADALRREPGVLVRSSGGLGGFSTVSLRGSPSEQVEVLLDGVPLGGSAGSTVDLGPIPLDGLERAEIFQAGSDGSGGAPRLELTSRKGWARLGGSLRAGSFGEQAASGWWGDAQGKASVSSWWERSRNDYPFPWDNGTRYNTSDDEIRRLTNNDYTGWGVAGAWRPREEWEGSIRLDGSDRGLSSPLLPDPKGRWDRQALQGGLRWTRTGEWCQGADASWRHGWSHWKDHDQSSGYQASTASRESADDGNLSWSLGRQSGGWWDPRASLGGRWEHSHRRSVGIQDVAETPDGSRGSGFASLGWSGKEDDRWGADLWLRGELARDERDFSMTLDGTSESPDTVLWRRASRVQGRVWARQGDASEWISLSRRERLPDFSEWMGDNGAGLPKPTLESEKSINAQLGGRMEGRRTGVELALWGSDFRDPIQATTAGSSPMVLHANGPGYDVAGADARLWARWGWLSGKTSATMQRARIRDPNPSLDGNEPRRTPRWKASAEFSAGPWLGFEAGYGLDAQGATWATELNSSDDRRSGRLLHGIWLRWRRGSATATALVRNLADVHTEDMEDLPLSGRQFQLRLEFDFAPSTRNAPELVTNLQENPDP
jgi:TonB-dependent Receptor Plug Domain